MREKRIVCGGIVFILLVMLLCGVLLEAEAAAEEPPEYRTAVVLSHDKTAQPDFIYNPEAIAAAYPQARVLCGTGALYLTQPERVAAVSSAVLRGRVTGIYYTCIAGQAWTQADFSVSECLRGGLAGGDTVSVYFPGGYLSAEDWAASHEEPPESDYLCVSVDGVPLPESGQELLLFLTRPAASPLPAGAYTLSCGPYSVYRLDPDTPTAIGHLDAQPYDTLKHLVLTTEHA